MMELVDKTQVLVAQTPLLRGRQGRQLLPHQRDMAGTGGIETTEQVQQGALARARCPQQRHGLPPTDDEVDTLEHAHVE